MNDTLMLSGNDLHLLHRHYINLTCIDSGVSAKQENGGKPMRYNFSAFVVDAKRLYRRNYMAAHDWGTTKIPMDSGLRKQPLFGHTYGQLRNTSALQHQRGAASTSGSTTDS